MYLTRKSCSICQDKSVLSFLCRGSTTKETMREKQIRSQTPEGGTDFHQSKANFFQGIFFLTAKTVSHIIGILYQLHQYHLSNSGGLGKDHRNPHESQLSPPAGLDSVSKAPKHQPLGSPQRPPLAANCQGARAKLQCRWIQNRENVNPAKQTVGRVI